MIDRARWTPQYYQRVLATDPIAYWMQDEKQGGVSYDMVTARSNGARNGAYTGVTLGQPGIGDGRTAALYDGLNDYDSIHTANFVAAFNPSEGTVLAWARVSAAGVWTDGAQREIFNLQVDIQNRIQIHKGAANNRTDWRYEANNTDNTNSDFAFTSTDWFSVGITWSVAADEARHFRNGVQFGATQNGLGVWVGALNAGNTVIGALGTVPTNNVWDGYLAHVSIWDRPLTPAEMLSLGVL